MGADVRWGLVLLLPLLLSSSTAAQEFVCRSTGVDSDPDGHRTWKVDTRSLARLPGIAADHVLVAAALGADTWNDNANGRTWQYTGSTGRTRLPLQYRDCEEAGVDFSLFSVRRCIVDDVQGLPSTSDLNVAAVDSPVCVDGQGTVHQHHIILYRSVLRSLEDEECTDVPWAVGEVDDKHVDVVAVLTHEFGHGGGLGHAEEDVDATMSANNFSAAQRDLFAYDVRCTNELSTLRERTPVVRRLGPDGRWGDEVVVDFDTVPVVDVATGFDKRGPVVAALRGDGTVFRRGLLDNAPVLRTHSAIEPGIGPSVVRWPETDDNEDRVISSSTGDYDDGEQLRTGRGSHHRVSYARSNDGFADHDVFGVLKHCAAMNGFFHCAGAPVVVRSGEAVASAFVPGNFGPGFSTGLTVLAWTQQERTAPFAQDQMVRIAIGRVNGQTLPTPSDLGVRSTVAPGVACRAGGAFDCLVAYVDPGDPSASVRVKRFNIITEPHKFGISIESGFHTVASNTSTTTRIAALFHGPGRRFWLVFRALRTNQPLEAWSSENGGTWQQDRSFAGSAVTGPSAGGRPNANEGFVVYTRGSP